MITFGAVFLVCMTVICTSLFAVSVAQSRHAIDLRDRSRLQRIIEKDPSHYVDRERLDTKCDICFGEFGNETIKVCECGRTFHVECADATAECPYCKRGRESMTARSAVKTVCPTCGRLVEENICECGTIIPDKDGTYVCRCGERTSITAKGCPGCGSTVRAEIGK